MQPCPFSARTPLQDKACSTLSHGPPPPNYPMLGQLPWRLQSFYSFQKPTKHSYSVHSYPTRLYSKIFFLTPISRVQFHLSLILSHQRLDSLQRYSLYNTNKRNKTNNNTKPKTPLPNPTPKPQPQLFPQSIDFPRPPDDCSEYNLEQMHDPEVPTPPNTLIPPYVSPSPHIPTPTN